MHYNIPTDCAMYFVQREPMAIYTHVRMLEIFRTIYHKLHSNISFSYLFSFPLPFPCILSVAKSCSHKMKCMVSCFYVIISAK